MITILFISFYYLPYSGTGVRRVLKFKYYLEKMGYKVIIVAPYRKDYTEKNTVFVKMPYLFQKLTSTTINASKYTETKKSWRNLLSHIISYFIRHFCIPDRQIFWIPFAVKECLRLSKLHNVSLIYTTSPPESSLIVGLILKLLLKKPWLAEFRDTWVYDPLNNLILKSKMRFSIESILERLIAKFANLIVVNSKIAENYFKRKYFLYDQSKIHTIYSGCDLRNPICVLNKRNASKFTIVHSGALSSSHFARTINPFLSGLNILANKDPVFIKNLKIIFIGDLAPHEIKLIEPFKKEGILTTMPSLSYEECIKIQANADLLLIINHTYKAPTANIPGKFFDYISLSKPILAITNDGALKDLMLEYGSFISSLADPQEICDQIMKVHELHNNGTLHKYVNQNLKILLSTENSISRLMKIINAILVR